jgi:3-phosphoinositide dependent protein kinase-1
LRQIKEAGGCTLPQVKFYAAEILLAIEHLHSRKIIHRDLKPENILLRANGHIVVTDFGTARIVADDEADLTTGDLKDRKNSFVGSADYVPPEILANEPAGFAADLWSFGCVIYTLIERRSPFRAENEYLTFQRILRLDLNFPQGFPEDARDLITKLLQRNPSSRLGAPPNSLSDIRKHPFFNGIDFENINSMEAPSRTRDKILIESKSYTDPNAKWRRFIRANEEILLAGYVIKRKGLFSKRRLLILSDYPRLVYVNVKKMEKRGEIPWSAGLRAELKDGNSFYIHTHSRSYYMQAEGISAQTWVEEINKPKRNFVESDLLPPPLDKSRKSRLSYLD